MIISPLRQASCLNRAQITTDPDPNRWVEAGLPKGWTVYSFQFFVRWNDRPYTIGDNFLMSRLIDLGPGETLDSVSDEDVMAAFTASGNVQHFANLEAVCARYDKRIASVLLPEIPVNNIVERTPIWSVLRSDAGELQIRRSTLDGLKRAFRRDRGGARSQLGRKGLPFGTSAVECALSRTEDIFPGDADAIIVDQLGDIRHVIEYKKHTRLEPLHKHLASRYYPKPDRRKYQSLDGLVSNLRTFDLGGVPLTILYFSTKLSEPLIRLQSIGPLRGESLKITRDSGDVSISGMSESEVGLRVMHWLDGPH